MNPTTLYAAENSEATFDVTLTNIGNTSGSFDLASTVPVNDWSVSNLQSSIFLSPGAAATHPVTVTITNGEPGVDYPVGIGAAAPTLPYTPTTAVTIYLVSASPNPFTRRPAALWTAWLWKRQSFPGWRSGPAGRVVQQWQLRYGPAR
ncbi:MAG: hypothetical protein M5U34_05195 [Chloroflexi bacterium]|nr:hypothetical protein [Chloroflexota bacterium]